MRHHQSWAWSVIRPRPQQFYGLEPSLGTVVDFFLVADLRWNVVGPLLNCHSNSNNFHTVSLQVHMVLTMVWNNTWMLSSTRGNAWKTSRKRAKHSTSLSSANPILWYENVTLKNSLNISLPKLTIYLCRY